jgi:hypothetical protein
MSLGMAAGAVAAYRSGQPTIAALFAVTGTGVVHLLAFGSYAWRIPRRTSRSGTLSVASDGTRGVRFAYSGWPYYLFAGAVGSFALALAALTALALADANGGVVALPVATACLGLALGWVLFTVLRLAPGAVILTPAGIHHRGLTFTYVVPWHAIYAVVAGWSGTPVIVVKATPSPDLRLRRYAGRIGPRELRLVPFLVVRAYWLATDPVLVYHALSFYYEHPESRAELSTSEALDRIRTGRGLGSGRSSP